MITGALKKEKADWVKSIKKSAGKIRHGLCLPDEETRAQAAGNDTGNEDWSGQLMVSNPSFANFETKMKTKVVQRN